MGVAVRKPDSQNDGLWFRDKEYVCDSNGKLQNFPNDLTQIEIDQINAHGFRLEPVAVVQSKEAPKAAAKA